MVKNLVLCFEGTSEGFGIPPPSNVIKLFSMLDKSSQICYYQPGIGTTFGGAVPDIESRGAFHHHLDLAKNTVDAAFALSFDSHVQAAYLFLMRFWEPGARTYIFGFSRGGYAARVLTGFLECFGLFHPGLEELVPMAWKVYREWEKAGRPKRDPNSLFLLQLHRMFGRDIRIHFLGVWDTVNLVGILTDRMFPFTICTAIVDHVRHAQSIDERRARFKHLSFESEVGDCGSSQPTVWSRLLGWLQSRSGQMPVECSDNILEVWFPGSHGDLGASTGFDEHGKRLSEVPFRWMVAEACNHGLKLDQSSVRSYWETNKPNDSILLYHHDRLSFKKPILPSEKDINTFEENLERFNGRGNSSLLNTLGWWIVELIPFSTRLPDEQGRWSSRFAPNLGQERILPKSARLHWTVFFRLSMVSDYNPGNLPVELGKAFVELLRRAEANIPEEKFLELESYTLNDIRESNLEHIWQQVPDELATAEP